jgi:hypothetical protein
MNDGPVVLRSWRTCEQHTQTFTTQPGCFSRPNWLQSSLNSALPFSSMTSLFPQVAKVYSTTVRITSRFLHLAERGKLKMDHRQQ